MKAVGFKRLMFMDRVMFLKRLFHWHQRWRSSPLQILWTGSLKGSVNIHINSANIDMNPLEIRSGKFDFLISSYDFRL
jgi:hypothetical protein